MEPLTLVLVIGIICGPLLKRPEKDKVDVKEKEKIELVAETKKAL
jgi:hypothetical protein